LSPAAPSLHSLPLFLRLVGRTVILLGDGDAASAKRRLLERAGAVITNDIGADAMLAVVALDGDAADAAATTLKARGLLVNVVDRPELCDFTTPAIVDRNPVIIAIGTGGASAGLAKQLRLRLETLLPSGLGELASGLAAAKAGLRSKYGDMRQRRAAIDAALTAGGPLDPLRDHDPAAVADWLANAAKKSGAMRTESVVITSADPDELTLRAARLLGEADVIVHDLAISTAILARARADAILIPAGSAVAPIDAGLVLNLTI
jgi:uroporphyrin-III C-methyltransferase / precorrin-2 dehydrogenase / sirohydrochlorin ferrochelatase